MEARAVKGRAVKARAVKPPRLVPSLRAITAASLAAEGSDEHVLIPEEPPGPCCPSATPSPPSEQVGACLAVLVRRLLRCRLGGRLLLHLLSKLLRTELVQGHAGGTGHRGARRLRE